MRRSHDLRTCLEAIGLLNDYLSRELDAEEEQRLRKHLRFCEECAQHFGFERWLRDMIREQATRQSAPERLRRWLDQMDDTP